MSVTGEVSGRNLFYLKSHFRKIKPKLTIKIDHSARCVEVSSRSRLFPGMRGERKNGRENEKKKRRRRKRRKEEGTTNERKNE